MRYLKRYNEGGGMDKELDINELLAYLASRGRGFAETEATADPEVGKKIAQESGEFKSLKEAIEAKGLWGQLTRPEPENSMWYLKRYNEGGGIPTNPLANVKTNDMLRHLSAFGEDNERKYDTSDLLNILAFSKGAKPQREGLMGGVDFSLPEDRPPADFVSYRTKKKGDTRIADYNEEKGGYNPSVGAMRLKEEQLERLSGRPLKGSEEADFRTLLNDPTLLRYFMDMMEEGDMNFRKAKLGKVKASKGGGADKSTRNPCPGGVCPSMAYD